MRVRLKIHVAILLICCWFAVPAPASESKTSAPEDFGPEVIDVSGYPSEHQRAYREVFLPVARFMGGSALLLNSPLIELDPGLEKAERARSPELFSDARLAQVSHDGWKRQVEEFRRRPPCCGACPVLTLERAKVLWRFLVYDSIARKTGPRAAAWIRHRRELLERFELAKQERNR